MENQPSVGRLDRHRRWMLPNVHREALLRNYPTFPDTMTLDELTAELVARDWETLDATGDGGGVTEQDIRVRLHHVDLPKLDDLGLLSYDPEERVITDLGGDEQRRRGSDRR